VLALLPALLLGPALGGMTVWVHAHDDHGGHVHVVVGHVHDGEQHALEHRHALAHRHDGNAQRHDDVQDEQPSPRGLLIELPEALAAARRERAVTAEESFVLALIPPAPREFVALTIHAPRLDPCRAVGPPGGANRSAVAELLRSSHALLI
jgi:hypothetical protein